MTFKPISEIGEEGVTPGTLKMTLIIPRRARKRMLTSVQLQFDTHVLVEATIDGKRLVLRPLNRADWPREGSATSHPFRVVERPFESYSRPRRGRQC